MHRSHWAGWRAGWPGRAGAHPLPAAPGRAPAACSATPTIGWHAVTDRARLLDEIKANAVVYGAVTLSSGRHADWYVDLRRVLLSGTAALLAGRVMLDLTSGLTYAAVGGLTLGADPVALAMMHAAAERGRELNSFIVRKSEKVHGLQRRIEGPDVAGLAVLAVEDTSTTGNSVLTAVDALTEAGADVVGVAVVVDRGAREAVERRGLPYLAAFDLADLGLS
jgi:orotate phosphoribosyltransferase